MRLREWQGSCASSCTASGRSGWESTASPVSGVDHGSTFIPMDIDDLANVRRPSGSLDTPQVLINSPSRLPYQFARDQAPPTRESVRAAVSHYLSSVHALCAGPRGPARAYERFPFGGVCRCPKSRWTSCGTGSGASTAARTTSGAASWWRPAARRSSTAASATTSTRTPMNT